MGSKKGVSKTRCMCWKTCTTCTEFQKITDLKDTAVVMYGNTPMENINKKVFIWGNVANRKGHNIVREEADIRRKAGVLKREKQINCQRCKKLNRIYELQRKESNINRTGLGICEHCRAQERLVQLSRKSMEIMRRILSSVKNVDPTQHRIRSWLHKLQCVFNKDKDSLIEDIEKDDAKHHEYSDLDIKLFKSTAKLMREPRVEELLFSPRLVSLHSRGLKRPSDSLSKRGDKKVIFIESQPDFGKYFTPSTSVTLVMSAKTVDDEPLQTNTFFKTAMPSHDVDRDDYFYVQRKALDERTQAGEKPRDEDQESDKDKDSLDKIFIYIFPKKVNKRIPTRQIKSSELMKDALEAQDKVEEEKRKREEEKIKKGEDKIKREEERQRKLDTESLVEKGKIGRDKNKLLAEEDNNLPSDMADKVQTKEKSGKQKDKNEIDDVQKGRGKKDRNKKDGDEVQRDKDKKRVEDGADSAGTQKGRKSDKEQKNKAELKKESNEAEKATTGGSGGLLDDMRLLREKEKQKKENEKNMKEKSQKRGKNETDQEVENEIKGTKKPKNIKNIDSDEDKFLKLVRIKRPLPRHLADLPVTLKDLKIHQHTHQHEKHGLCPLCSDSDLELAVETLVMEEKQKNQGFNIIIGEHIHKFQSPIFEHDSQEKVPAKLFTTNFVAETVVPEHNAIDVEDIVVLPTKGQKGQATEQLPPKGVIHYALSDRTFIDKGWTLLPTEKIVRKMNVYRMRPAHPEFDWFVHNKNKRLMQYDTGEKMAEFDDNGRGRWYYKNGRLALDYYDAEEQNAQQRFVIYSSGEPDERGRSRPATILATFDYLGNGIVFDHTGKIRLKYNQTEGVILDRSLGPVSHWKWHTLNDPPVLQQVMIDTQMAVKDPIILKLGNPLENKPRQDNEEILAIEFDNFIREKSKKMSQAFKPFQIRMKALKINEYFSLKVLDQASVYLIFRSGSANIKLNIGMILDHHEIVDTDTADLGEVSSNLTKLPACTDSIAAIQDKVSRAQRIEKFRIERESCLRPTMPRASVDNLHAAASRPLRPQLQTSNVSLPSGCRCNYRKPNTNNLYYNTRLI